MSDKDSLLARGIPFFALVDELGVSTDGTLTSVSTIRSRSMEPICSVNSSGVAASGSTLTQMRSRAIRVYCPVTENAVTSDAVSVSTLSSRGISYFCPVDINGIAIGGTSTLAQLAAKGLPFACFVDSSGNSASIALSASTFTANAAQNTAIGTLSVVGGTGTYTFTLTDSHTNAVQVAGTNGVNLQVGSAASSAGSFSITVHADNGAGSTFDKVFLITASPVGGAVALKADLSDANANEAWVFW